jgi:hypothetical protein
VFDIKFVLVFSNIFLQWNKSSLVVITEVRRSSNKGLIWYIIIKIKFGRESLVKIPDIKVHENPSRGTRVVPCG